MILGEILKEYRSKHSLSMDKFAELSGLTKGYISMLEKNQHPKTKKALLQTLDTLKKVAKGMSISVGELIEQLDTNQDIALTSMLIIVLSEFEYYLIFVDKYLIR